MFGVELGRKRTVTVDPVRLDKKLAVQQCSAATPEVTATDRLTTLENLKFNESGFIENYSEIELKETLTGISNFDFNGTALESFRKNHIAMTNIAYLASEYQDPSIKSLASLILNQIIASDKKGYLVFGANDEKNLINFQALVSANPDDELDSYQKVAKFLSELKSRIISHFIEKISPADLFCYSCQKSMADELALGFRGFIKITLANGKDANLCRNCFDGW